MAHPVRVLSTSSFRSAMLKNIDKVHDDSRLQYPVILVLPRKGYGMAELGTPHSGVFNLGHTIRSNFLDDRDASQTVIGTSHHAS